MSNHSGSYMLNKVLRILEANNVLGLLGKARSRRLVREVVELSERTYDCNRGEVLEGLQEILGVCSYCLKSARKFSDGLCAACKKELQE